MEADDLLGVGGVCRRLQDGGATASGAAVPKLGGVARVNLPQVLALFMPAAHRTPVSNLTLQASQLHELLHEPRTTAEAFGLQRPLPQPHLTASRGGCILRVEALWRRAPLCLFFFFGVAAQPGGRYSSGSRGSRSSRVRRSAITENPQMMKLGLSPISRTAR